jgi:hypothetical protein
MLSITGSFTYTMNEGAFDPIAWGGIDPQAQARFVDTGKWDYGFQGVDGLSDIDTTTMEARLMADFMINEQFSIYGDLLYGDWEDTEWIIEDGTGDYIAGSAGLVVSF